MESNPEGEYHPELVNSLFSTLQFNPLTEEIIIALLAMVLLLLGSAMVSGSEVAFFSLGQSRLNELNGQDKKVKRLLYLLERPRLLLATILIANNLFNIAIIILSAFVLNLWLGFGGPESEVSPVLEFAIGVLLVTFLLVLFGEVIPKVYANYHNVNFALSMSGPLLFMRNIFQPLAMVLVNSTRVLEKRLSQHQNMQVTREEVDHAIELATDANTTPEEKEILKGIVKFGDITVKQIMHPRMDIVAIEVEEPFSEVFKIVLESGFSRIPVYQDNLDQIDGILYAKDLLKYLDEPDTFEWQKLIRRVFYVPETKKIEHLLKEFQHKHIHLAIAVDEYGGTSGIVTLEDIMEEIIGEIKDEYDIQEELEYEKINDGEYIFEGKTLINDLCKVMNIKSDYFDEVKGDADSLAGMLLELFQKMPEQGETADYNNFSFEVLSVTKKRIQQVKVMLQNGEYNS